MKYLEIFDDLEKKKIYLFNIDDLQKISPSDRNTVKQQIHYWKTKNWIQTLKKGLYEINYPKRKTLPDLYVANKLYEPSYISLETALSHYSLIPEVAMGVTSITTKPTRKFRNHYGLFQYRQIVERAYCGYRLIDYQGQKIKIAEPEKAITDYLYYNTSKDLEELRLNKRKTKKLNKEKMQDYAKQYNKQVEKKVRECTC